MIKTLFDSDSLMAQKMSNLNCFSNFLWPPSNGILHSAVAFDVNITRVMSLCFFMHNMFSKEEEFTKGTNKTDKHRLLNFKTKSLNTT